MYKSCELYARKLSYNKVNKNTYTYLGKVTFLTNGSSIGDYLNFNNVRSRIYRSRCFSDFTFSFCDRNGTIIQPFITAGGNKGILMLIISKKDYYYNRTD